LKTGRILQIFQNGRWRERAICRLYSQLPISRHKSMDVLQAYVRDADLFRDHAGAGLL
jgi:hypothetical protein